MALLGVVSPERRRPSGPPPFSPLRRKVVDKRRVQYLRLRRNALKGQAITLYILQMKISRPVGRPRGPEPKRTVTFFTTERQVARLDALAERAGRSRSALLNEMLAEWLGGSGSGKAPRPG